MTRGLYSRLFSTRTLIRVGFVALSLYCVGTAFAQGATAMGNPPAYGSTWAADFARSHSLDERNVSLESSKATRTEAPRITDSNARFAASRTGG